MRPAPPPSDRGPGRPGEDRYASLRRIAWWRQDRLRRATAVVAGVGALGNEVAKNLALLGFGRLVLVDFDAVEASNLARSVLFRPGDDGRPKVEAASRRLAELNPGVRVVPIEGDVALDLGLGLLAEADLAFGCLDSREARLALNQACWQVTTPWIDGAIQEISGTVKTFVPPDGTCYECGFTDEDYRHLGARYSCRGLRTGEMSRGKVPTTPTIASIVAGLAVQEGLKLLHGLEAAASRALVYTGETHLFYDTRLPRRDDCLAHDTLPEPLAAGLGADRSTAADVLRLAAPSDPGAELALGREFVTCFRCEPCGRTRDVFELRARLTQDQGLCPCCGEPMWPEPLSVLTAGHDLADRRLSELGVPAFDILTVRTRGRRKAVLLAGDRDAFLPLDGPDPGPNP